MLLGNSCNSDARNSGRSLVPMFPVLCMPNSFKQEEVFYWAEFSCEETACLSGIDEFCLE
jgi:hypothetical protein